MKTCLPSHPWEPLTTHSPDPEPFRLASAPPTPPPYLPVFLPLSSYGTTDTANEWVTENSDLPAVTSA